MNGKFNDSELLFVEETLDQHGEFLCDLLTESIEKKHLIKSEDLLNSINYKVTHYGIDPVLVVDFFTYGRFIELNYFKRSQNAKKLSAPDTKSIMWGIRQNRSRITKKDTRWYAKTAYGSINRLIAILSYEYTEDERNRLKTILQRRANES